MIDVSINNAIKNFGYKRVFDGLSLEVKTGERVALIGSNGCGKTTLLKTIYGEEYLDQGEKFIRKGATIGLLLQIPPVSYDNLTVRDILLMPFEELFEIENKLRDYEEKIAISPPNKLENILKSYGKLQERYINMGGYEIDEKVSKVCGGFKISSEKLDQIYSTLSGGEKTIVNLASLIISNPDILLLDEPTNHLDIDTLEWFEEFLSHYKGTIIISSHDRYFLDKVTTKTILINRGVTEIYHGNYSYYLKESERRLLAEFDSYKNQQKQIEAMQNTIKKLREWGARGDNPRFFRRAACIERRLEKMEVIDKPESKEQLPLSFEIDNRSGKDVLTVKNLVLKISDKVLLDNTNMHLQYGEKVCIMGKNGAGKSTFIKSILYNENIYQGEIKLGSNIKVGYISQEIKFDNENATILEVSRKFFTGTETQLRASLSKFFFCGENVFKKVSQLSGGEKVRLKLFELLYQKANFLILDEPTNHIDIDTKEILEDALTKYRGTILFISHDRYFINKIAERIVNIENRKFREYLGNYDYYKEIKNKEMN